MTEGLKNNFEQEADVKYPFYSSYKRIGQEDNFLTVNELETQTDSFLKSFGDQVEQNNLPDSFFFLDKSARPLAFLVKQLWGTYYPEVPLPAMRFVNIGGSGSRIYDNDSRPFNKDPEIIKTTYGDHIQADGRIHIVDEYSHTGEALKNANEIFKKAFPDANITTQAAYSKLPNWYQNNDYLGVEEYNSTDYEQLALKQLNQELGTRYNDLWKFKSGKNVDLWDEDLNDNGDVDYENITPEIKQKYYSILEKISGSIPYVKKGEHIQTYYKKENPSLTDRLKAFIKGELPEKKSKPYQVNHFLEARQELKQISEEIKSKYLPK